MAADFLKQISFKSPVTIIAACVFLGVIVLSLIIRRSGHHLSKQQRLFNNGTHNYESTVIILSLDGFKPAYLDLDLNPNLLKFAADGVQAAYMRPSFPSLTFPNHYTLVTGKYPSEHGIVANEFYDPMSQREFSYMGGRESLDSFWWEGADPIWVAAENQGVISASHMWVGSEAVIHGVTPTFVDKYNGSETYSSKVNRVMEWLDLPIESRPRLVTMYAPHPDHEGHIYGPFGDAVKLALANLDSLISGLVDGLKQRNLYDIVDLLIVSDHGMAANYRENVFFIDEILDMNLIEHIDGWPLYGLRPYDISQITPIYRTLKQHSKDQHWQVFLKKDLPSRWHFSKDNNPRIAPLWIIPDPEWAIVTKAEFELSFGDPNRKVRGLHGYDNFAQQMRALFLAHGPHFSPGQVEPFSNVEVYEIMTKILDIEPDPNNGTLHGELQYTKASKKSELSNDSDSLVTFTPKPIMYLLGKFTTWFS